MPSNINVELKPYNPTGNFKFFCQKVLPLVYDDSLSFYEVLCKMVVYLNEMIDNNDGLYQDIVNLKNAFESLQDYVNDSFDNLNVQEILEGMLEQIINGVVQLAGVTQCYNTTTELLQEENAISNGYYITLGYNTINDGGAGLFKCSDSEIAGCYKLEGVKDFYLIEEYINPMQVGAHGDGQNDDREIIESCFTFCTENNVPFKSSPNKEYLILNNGTNNEAKYLRLIRQTGSEQIEFDFNNSTLTTNQLDSTKFLFCISANDVVVKNINLQCNGNSGVLVGNYVDTANYQTRNSKIENVTINNANDGIVFKDSSNNVITDGLYIYNSTRGLVYTISHVLLSDGNWGYSFSNWHRNIYLYGLQTGLYFRSCQNIWVTELTAFDVNSKMQYLVTGGHLTEQEILVSNIGIDKYGSQNISFNEQYVDIKNVDGFIATNTNCLNAGNFYGTGFFGSMLLQGQDLYHKNYQQMNLNIDCSGENTLVHNMTDVTHNTSLRQNHNSLNVSGSITFTCNQSVDRTPFFQVQVPDALLLKAPVLSVASATATYQCIVSMETQDDLNYLRFTFNGMDSGTYTIYFAHALQLITDLYR